MADVTRHGEISLGGNFYPIIGKVKKSLASTWPEKQIIGDYTKDSEKWVSSWVQNDWSGGIGVKNMDETKHANRSFFSQLNTDYPGHMFMPFAVNAGEDDPAAADPLSLIPYNNLQYVVWSNRVVEVWNNTTAAFDAPGGGAHTIATAAPTDAIVHKGKLYFANGTDIERYDGTNWTTGNTLSGAVRAARYFCEWDGKLFYITNAGALFWSSDQGVTWNANAASNLAAGSFTDLFTYLDGSGTLIIYLGTTTGPWFLDYDNSDWIPTELQFPEQPDGCRGCAVWRGDLYVPVGLTVYRYRAGAVAEITTMGPGDTDYGLDTDYRGSIVQLTAELNHLYALLKRATSTTFPPSILRWNGKGWGSFFHRTATNTVSPVISISRANSTYRLWFTHNVGVNYINLPSDIYNPLELPIASFPLESADTYHYTPWFDANNGTLNKTALRLKLEVLLKQDASTENRNKITVAYGLDFDDSTWTTIGTATKTTDGEGIVNFDWDFGSSAGVVFKSIRFRFIFNSTSLSADETPDLHWIRLEYVKNIETQYGFETVVDASRDYRHKRASTLVTNLETAVETQTLLTFVHRTFQETSATHYVRIVGMDAVVEAGRVREGVFHLRMVAA